MDDYGCCNLDDAGLIADTLKESGSVVFSFSLDGFSAYVVCMTSVLNKIGVMPFGGNPSGSICVAVLLKGAYWFDSDADKEPGYVGEKLGLSGRDAENVTSMLNAVFKRLR